MDDACSAGQERLEDIQDFQLPNRMGGFGGTEQSFRNQALHHIAEHTHTGQGVREAD